MCLNQNILIPKFAKTPVPAWLALTLIACTTAGSFFILSKYATNANYTVHLDTNGDTKETLTYGAWPALANADFFQKIHASFVDQKTPFVEANLSEMKLRVYENGQVIKEVPILTKGRIGSWWETPAGLYRAEGKYENHFSSLGHVYLPWSIPFQGNFFIHGWPYYEDGTPVATKYSGGCIRLDTNDAKAVYDLIKPGEPILVYAHTFEPDNFVYKEQIPGVTAESFLAADLKNNHVFLSQNTGDVRSIASVTKLMTALVATEYINIEHPITIKDSDIVPTSKARLTIGQSVSIFDLLFPLLMESSNEAAHAISGYLGQSYFVELMNKKAAALGMTHSHYADSSGSSAENVSTTEDLFNLAKYLYGNRKFILGVTAGKSTDSIYGNTSFGALQNFNVFQDDPRFVGGKVGLTTAAKETIMSIFEITVNGEKRPIVIIALGSTDNGGDVSRILSYITRTY